MKTDTNKPRIYKENEDSKTLYVEMGKRLRIIRIEENYTQEQFAEILGMSTAYYSKVERGIHGLSLKKLVEVYEKLNVDINYLLTGARNSALSVDTFIKECPKNKRYDLEQLLKYALNLAKNNE